MKSFCEYYDRLPFHKKMLTILFCPCVTLYYLIYNLIKELMNCLVFVSNRCLCPILNSINKGIAWFFEKICNFLDCFFDAIMKIISKFFEFFCLSIEKILSLFKPCFSFISAILNYIFNKICFLFKRIHAFFESLCLFLMICCEKCFSKAYGFVCKPICDRLNECCKRIYEFHKKYIFIPIINVIKRIWTQLSRCFTVTYRTFIKPINDYLLLPIYKCMMKYFIKRIYYFFKAIFGFLYKEIHRIFVKIKEFLIEIKNLIFSLFILLFLRGNRMKQKGIISAKPTKNREFKVVDVRKDQDDLENSKEKYYDNIDNIKFEKNSPPQIFCLENKDFIYDL